MITYGLHILALFFIGYIVTLFFCRNVALSGSRRNMLAVAVAVVFTCLVMLLSRQIGVNYSLELPVHTGSFFVFANIFIIMVALAKWIKGHVRARWSTMKLKTTELPSSRATTASFAIFK
jgi:hypothetical protein